MPPRFVRHLGKSESYLDGLDVGTALIAGAGLITLVVAAGCAVFAYNWALAWAINWLLASFHESARVTWVQVFVFNIVFGLLFRTRFTSTTKAAPK